MPRKSPLSDQFGLFDETDAKHGTMSLAEIEERLGEIDRTIAELDAERARLRRVRRAKKGGEAARGRPRKRRFAVDKVLDLYLRNGGADEWPYKRYGARKATAERLGMSERHVGRIIAAHKAEIRRRLEGRPDLGQAPK